MVAILQGSWYERRNSNQFCAFKNNRLRPHSCGRRKNGKEKAMGFENLDAVIDFAIEKEIEAAEFYRNLSRQETFSGSEKMFNEFAAEERKHQKLLTDFKASGITQSIKEYKLKWITDIKRSDYAVDLEYHNGMAYNEILMLAMKREEKSLKLYNDFLDQTETQDSKKLFKILCQEEAKHKLALETLYDDYMAKMGD
jgi:rubrerythrin